MGSTTGSGMTTGGLDNDTDMGTSTGETDDSGGGSGIKFDTPSGGGTSGGAGSGGEILQDPTLWYSVDSRLFYIPIDPATGLPLDLVASDLQPAPQLGQNGITMLDNGSLLLSRENEAGTVIYHVPEPSEDGTPSSLVNLGAISGIRIEALYTDCEGLVYLMDTGEHTTNPIGNRLLRFSGDFLAGDLGFEVITDLQNASVADIDDMSPGINASNEITDALGYAIDTGAIHAFDYNTGTGNLVGMGGTYGVHALGGPLFDDDLPRLYVFDKFANLYMADPNTYALSLPLITGPLSIFGDAGHSGLAGPLTECETTFPPPG